MHAGTDAGLGPFVQIGRVIDRPARGLTEGRAAAGHSELGEVSLGTREAVRIADVGCGLRSPQGVLSVMSAPDSDAVATPPLSGHSMSSTGKIERRNR